MTVLLFWMRRVRALTQADPLLEKQFEPVCFDVWRLKFRSATSLIEVCYFSSSIKSVLDFSLATLSIYLHELHFLIAGKICTRIVR